MNYEARILLDSIAHGGHSRLTTFKLVYPRFIHAEFMTHRVFSRNTSSSRAIPYAKLREQVLQYPAKPLVWGSNQKGMMAGEPISTEAQRQAEEAWLDARDKAVLCADRLAESGLHKQHVNRVLEPFMWVTVICSATSYLNFFRLRRAEDAQPEIRFLADLMFDAYQTSTPEVRYEGEWHMPFIDLAERRMETLETCKHVSVARCARVSYLNFEGKRDVAADCALYDRLAQSGHWSPFEHVALVGSGPTIRSGNFSGFRQLREFVDI